MFAKLAGQKQAFIICRHLCLSPFSCDCDAVVQASLLARKGDACSFSDNLDGGQVRRGRYFRGVLSFSFPGVEISKQTVVLKVDSQVKKNHRLAVHSSILLNLGAGDHRCLGANENIILTHLTSHLALFQIVVLKY